MNKPKCPICRTRHPVKTCSLLSETPAPKEYRCYIDVDGVLVGHRSPGDKRKTIAFDAVNFMHFLTSRFGCYWLSPLSSRGDATPVVKYICRYFSNIPPLEQFLWKVRPTAFTVPRTNIFLAGEQFFWLTPEISRTEEEDLEARGLFNNHIPVDSRKDFNALAKARDFLREELNSDA